MLRPVTKKEKIRAEESIRTVQGDPDTICEHIRIIFRTAEEEIKNRKTRGRIMRECIAVFTLAKRMNARLIEYSQRGDGIRSAI